MKELEKKFRQEYEKANNYDLQYKVKRLNFSNMKKDSTLKYNIVQGFCLTSTQDQTSNRKDLMDSLHLNWMKSAFESEDKDNKEIDKTV